MAVDALHVRRVVGVRARQQQALRRQRQRKRTTLGRGLVAEQDDPLPGGAEGQPCGRREKNRSRLSGHGRGHTAVSTRDRQTSSQRRRIVAARREAEASSLTIVLGHVDLGVRERAPRGRGRRVEVAESDLAVDETVILATPPVYPH